jgi:hypothetical protein
MKMGGPQILTTVTTKMPGKELGGLEAITNPKKSIPLRSPLKTAGMIAMMTMTTVAK